MNHPSQRQWTRRNLSSANIPTINMPCRFRECVWEMEQIPSSAWLSFNNVNDEELLKPNWFYLHQRLLCHGHQSADENYTFMSVTGGKDVYSFRGIRKFRSSIPAVEFTGSHVLYTYSCNYPSLTCPTACKRTMNEISSSSEEHLWPQGGKKRKKSQALTFPLKRFTKVASLKNIE